MTEFSDYIIFVDESGDHGLDNIDPEFSVFALAFCIIKKADYVEKVVPSVQKLKFDFWGHDGVILHEHELRKSNGDFAFLRSNAKLRENFMARLSDLVEMAPFEIIASVIDKERLRRKYSDPWSPYDLEQVLNNQSRRPCSRVLFCRAFSPKTGIHFSGTRSSIDLLYGENS